MKQFLQCIYISFALLMGLNSCQKSLEAETGSVRLTFVNKVKTSPLVLNTQAYTNRFNESYTVSKFKYYITNVRLQGTSGSADENNSYHLVDAALPASLSFDFETGLNTYSTVEFLLGVDSTRNVSGAQTGALDPLNDMFWTWNSGYVMSKMEGNSPQSNQAGQKIEYHIGGFKGGNSVLRTITLPFPANKVAKLKPGKTSEIVIEADLDSWWHTPHNIKIANLPVCTTPGSLAKRVADNYSKMFTVTDVLNNQ